MTTYTAVQRSIPKTIDTACRMLNEAWERHAWELLDPERGILVEDSEAALNWDAFLGRSVPIQPSRNGASVFVGTRGELPDFSPLRERGIRLRDLAELWQIQPLREHFMHRGEREGQEPAAASCSTLLASGGPAGQLLCEAFQEIPPSSSHWSVRALLQNASLLAGSDYSFRQWLEREARTLGASEFPPRDFRQMVITAEPNGVAQLPLEMALVRIMGRVFHRASGPVAAHMVCDWQLCLWAEGRTDVFDLYPYDIHHRRFVAFCGDLPDGADEFTQWWHAQPGCADLPPRLASACMACVRPSVTPEA